MNDKGYFYHRPGVYIEQVSLPHPVETKAIAAEWSEEDKVFLAGCRIRV
jgi:hypothetical protein